MLKVYDLVRNADLLANSSNHEIMFPDYPRGIPQMFVSKIFIPSISPGYFKVMKRYLEVKKFKKLFCGLSCENFKIGCLLSCNVFLNLSATVLHLG